MEKLLNILKADLSSVLMISITVDGKSKDFYSADLPDRDLRKFILNFVKCLYTKTFDIKFYCVESESNDEFTINL